MDFSKQYLESRARQGSGIATYGMARRAERMLSHIRSSGCAPKRMLDLGTADGKMLMLMAPSISPALWVGVDSNRELLKAARLPEGWTGGPTHTDGRQLPFRTGTFDLVIAAATIKHVRDPGRLFDETRRVLQTGGCFIVSDPTPMAIWFGLRMGHFDARWLENRWSLSGWNRAIEPAGFRCGRAERYMMFPRRLPGGDGLERVMRRTLLSKMFLHQIATFEAV